MLKQRSHSLSSLLRAFLAICFFVTSLSFWDSEFVKVKNAYAQDRFPLGIHLVPDTDINNFWNNHLLPTDVSTGWTPNINFVAASPAGVKVLVYGEGVDPAKVMDQALASNIPIVMANIESISDIDALIAKEINDYQIAKAKKLTFIFAPMGTTLRKYYSYNDYAMLKNADIIFFQT